MPTTPLTSDIRPRHACCAGNRKVLGAGQRADRVGRFVLFTLPTYKRAHIHAIDFFRLFFFYHPLAIPFTCKFVLLPHGSHLFPVPFLLPSFIRIKLGPGLGISSPTYLPTHPGKEKKYINRKGFLTVDEILWIDGVEVDIFL